MFVVLDTNHFRELREDTAAGRNLQRRIEEREANVFTCIVAVEETIEGWFALIKRHAAGRDQITAYGRLHRSIEALIKLPILPFDDAAADAFHRLRDARVRVGTMDLKIAAICMASGRDAAHSKSRGLRESPRPACGKLAGLSRRK